MCRLQFVILLPSHSCFGVALVIKLWCVQISWKLLSTSVASNEYSCQYILCCVYVKSHNDISSLQCDVILLPSHWCFEVALVIKEWYVFVCPIVYP